MTYLFALCLLALPLLGPLIASFVSKLWASVSNYGDDIAGSPSAPEDAATRAMAATETHPNHPPVGGSVLAGVLLIATFFGGFLAWMGTAPLQSAAIAQGSVSLDTYRKTIQHLEGGIIEKILVREGQNVAKGEILFQLDETQPRSRIDLLEAQISSGTKQLELITDELVSIEGLFRKGLTTQTRVLALKRRLVELEGDRTVKIAQLRAAKDVLDRSKIRTPISGTVVSLQVHTSGGVIKPGDTLLSIVPADEPLVVEAQINPNDIDVVHKGLSAQVRLTPLNARMVPPLSGHIAWISADIIHDEKSKASYYLSRIEIAAAPADLPKGVDLYPGMPAEVIITTGERTFLNYLVTPISRSFRRAFREE